MDERWTFSRKITWLSHVRSPGEVDMHQFYLDVLAGVTSRDGTGVFYGPLYLHYLY